MFKKNELTLFIKDRFALGMMIAGFVVLLAIFALTVINVRFSDVQVPIRYSDYGFTNLYRDRWYSLIYFLLFACMSFLVSGYLAIKLLGSRYRLAVSLIGMNLTVLIMTLIIVIAVFRLAVFSL